MQTVQLTVSDGVATVRLDRPDRLNAVTAALVDDLLAALETVAADETVRVVVFTGAGRAFCAGHDLKEQTPPGDPRARLERLQNVTRRLRALRQPVIAAVHGYAIGAGAEFALGCDLIVAADDAVFSFPEAGLGLSVTGAASRLLPLLVGPLKARELVLLGERVDAPAAAELGLVNTVVARERLDDHVGELATALAAKPAASVALAKRAIDQGIDSTLDTALELEVSHALVTEHAPELARGAEEFGTR